MDIERLRALENKWREMANDRANAEWVTLVNCANDLRDLIAELGQEVAAVGDGTCYDRGPWRWERTGSKVDVFSDDFTCDVALRIDGDFATDDVADSYAKWLADTLNGHITSPAHTSESRDAELLDWLRVNEFDLVTRREDIGEDEYAIWWFVVDYRKSTRTNLHTVSGHPLGSPREAIIAAMERQNEGAT